MKDLRDTGQTAKGATPTPSTAAPVQWPARVKEVALKLALIIGSTALSLFFIEAALRFVAPQQLILVRPDVWQACPELGWCMAPNLDTRINTGERTVRLLTDASGYRVGISHAPRAAVQVLALGDSFLAGIQVDYADLFSARLEKQLGDHLGYPVSVVNTGVGGWGPSHYLIKLRQELNRVGHRLVLVFLFAGNDFEATRVREFSPRLASTKHQFRIPRRLSGAEIVRAWGYPLNSRLEQKSHLYVLFKNRLWSFLMRAGLSARAFPSALTRGEADSDRWGLTADICAEMDSLAREHDVACAFVLLPGAYQVNEQLGLTYARNVGLPTDSVDLDQPSRMFDREFGRRGLTFVDTLPALRAFHEDGDSPLFGTIDTHLAPAGHEVVAEVVLPMAEALLRKGGS